MMRVFLDANVLFSASYASSNIARLIHLLIKQGEAVTSDFAVEEARRNIMLKRSAWDEDSCTLIEQIQIVPSIQFDLPIELAEKDQPILCTAIRSKCQYLATGDKQDFGHLYGHNIQGVTVVTLVILAEILMQSRDNSG